VVAGGERQRGSGQKQPRQRQQNEAATTTRTNVMPTTRRRPHLPLSIFPLPDSPRSSRCHPADELGHPSARVHGCGRRSNNNEKGASELPPSKFVQSQKNCRFAIVPVCAGLCRFVPVCAGLCHSFMFLLANRLLAPFF
jgi:hypothetical protein